MILSTHIKGFPVLKLTSLMTSICHLVFKLQTDQINVLLITVYVRTTNIRPLDLLYVSLVIVLLSLSLSLFLFFILLLFIDSLHSFLSKRSLTVYQVCLRCLSCIQVVYVNMYVHRDNNQMARTVLYCTVHSSDEKEKVQCPY